jgi:hypothetical protein
MNPHERRLANEAHYRRLAATARTNQTFITPRYAMAPPEYLDDRVRDPHADQHDMYSFQPEYAPQQDSYEAAMMVRLGDTRFAGEEIVDPFPRYPQTRRLGLPRWANGSQYVF